jgi:hypothetical protein
MLFPAAPRQLIRIACQIYNDESQVQTLAQALVAELRPERS